MARRAERHLHDEPEHDVWSETWGDRALQALGRRLVEYGLSEEQAALVVEQTWLFYSYVALPTLHERLPMGIATRRGETLPEVFLFLIFRSYRTTFEHFNSEMAFKTILETFEWDFAVPLAMQVAMSLRHFEPKLGMTSEEFQNRRRIEVQFRAYARGQQLDDVGVFVDDLSAELTTIMDAESVPEWLNTPNTLFAGRPPAEFLDDPLDRTLRDIITRAKFNLSAA